MVVIGCLLNSCLCLVSVVTLCGEMTNVLHSLPLKIVMGQIFLGLGLFCFSKDSGKWLSADASNHGEYLCSFLFTEIIARAQQ